MNDAPLVRIFESLGDLSRDLDGLFERDGAGGNALGQRGTFDKRQDERLRAGVLFEAMDGADIRMVERRQQTGFALESGHAVDIVRQGGGQYFDGHVAPEPRIASPVHLSHAARADGVEDLVGAEFIAGGKRHSIDSVQFSRL